MKMATPARATKTITTATMPPVGISLALQSLVVTGIEVGPLHPLISVFETYRLPETHDPSTVW